MVRGGGFGSFQRRYLRVDRDGQRDNMLGFCEMCLPNTMAENTMFRQCSPAQFPSRGRVDAKSRSKRVDLHHYSRFSPPITVTMNAKTH